MCTKLCIIAVGIRRMMFSHMYIVYHRRLDLGILQTDVHSASMTHVPAVFSKIQGMTGRCGLGRACSHIKACGLSHFHIKEKSVYSTESLLGQYVCMLHVGENINTGQATFIHVHVHRMHDISHQYNSAAST